MALEDTMFEIEGKHGKAACYATNIEDGCVEQIRAMLDMPFAEGANTAIMPDAHYGVGCTIGTTMKVTDAVVPNLVGGRWCRFWRCWTGW